MIKIKTNINTSIILICLLFTLSSCYDNNIYFDINSQSVVSCNKKVIENLHIISKDSKYFYSFSKLSKLKGTNSFNLVEINHSYSLENINREISIDSFRLRPETEYEIVNSTFGDATSSKILIKTDKNRKVAFSNIKTCK